MTCSTIQPLSISSWTYPESSPRFALCDRSTIHSPNRLGFTVVALVEPTTYGEAAVHQLWQHAMAEEIAALERTGTWHLVPLPPQSVEVELRAMAAVTTLVTLDTGVLVSTPTPLSSDSIDAVSISRDPVKNELTISTGVDASYKRSQVHALVVTPPCVLGGFFTKAQIRALHSYLLSKLSVVEPP